MAWPEREGCTEPEQEPEQEPEGDAEGEAEAERDSEIALRPHLPKWHFASAAATAADSILISSGRMKKRLLE